MSWRCQFCLTVFEMSGIITAENCGWRVEVYIMKTLSVQVLFLCALLPFLVACDGGSMSKPMVTIETDRGKIVIQLYTDAAPVTVENFLTLVEQGFYDGLTFHRYDPGFVIQAGDPKGNGQNLHTILGKILRITINPNTASYQIPSDNPFYNNQIMGIIKGVDLFQFEQVFSQNKSWFFNQFKNHMLANIENYVFSKGINKELNNYIKDHYGYLMNLQKDEFPSLTRSCTT